MLALVFIISSLCLICHLFWIKNMPLRFIVLMAIPMFFVFWHKVYQCLYDLKLIFFRDQDYEISKAHLTEETLPTITFIIPSYQEPFQVAKMTFDSVVNAPYKSKKEIIVVDNSRDVTSDDFQQWKQYVENFSKRHRDKKICVRFFYNSEAKTLKPGNLDLAQRFIEEGEFVVFLDVDSTLPNNGDLLERAVANFKADGNLGFLQFRIKATNAQFNALTRAVAANQDLLRFRMVSRGYGGYKIFEGHNGMWRKSVLDQLGAWTDYYRHDIIITEDIFKTIQVYSKGYYGKPLNIVTGEWVPSSLKAFESMWMRWMYGNSQVFFKYFKEIYSGHISPLEKIDVSYHVLHHFVTLFALVISLVLQVIVKGPITNIFIITVGLIPQLIGALTGYLTSDNDTSTRTQKVVHYYAGFFLIETFITSVQIKSSLKFMLGIPQGWKVTEKGIEKAPVARDLIYNNLFYILMVLFSLAVCIISWIINYDMKFSSWIYHAGLLFTTANLALCIIAFGKQRRKSLNDIHL